MNSHKPFPEAFVERLERQFGAEGARRTLEGLSADRVTSFRINRLRRGDADPLEEVRKEGIVWTPVRFFPDAAWVAPAWRQKLILSNAYLEKRIYVQNLASMLPVLYLSPTPEDRILDLAAAPGSKTLQIAGAVGVDTEIAAVELSRKRFFRMKNLLAEYGAEHVRTFLRDGASVWRVRPEYFDRVLLDAPCASEGRFQPDDPESMRYWSPKKAREMVRKQKRLLDSAVRSTRTGGVIVYSTCSLSAEENEGVVSDILERFEGALETEPLDTEFRGNLEGGSGETLDQMIDELEPPMASWKEKPFHPGVAPARRIRPSERMEGFFICRLRKTASVVGE